MIQVAVAIIVNQQQQVLITQRPENVSHGGYWEFPGGKLEAGETAEEALIREIKEEVGLEIHQAQFLLRQEHHYPQKVVELAFYLVREYSGMAYRCEGQLNLQWVNCKNLNPRLFPEANYALIEKLPFILEADLTEIN